MALLMNAILVASAFCLGALSVGVSRADPNVLSRQWTTKQAADSASLVKRAIMALGGGRLAATAYQSSPCGALIQVVPVQAPGGTTGGGGVVFIPRRAGPCTIWKYGMLGTPPATHRVSAGMDSARIAEAAAAVLGVSEWRDEFVAPVIIRQECGILARVNRALLNEQFIAEEAGGLVYFPLETRECVLVRGQ
jgi:hypothetical protein